MYKSYKRTYNIGSIVELTHHISDGYTESGDYNVIFPPPTLVKVVEIRDRYFKYGVKVIKECELPKNLQGKQFRSVIAKQANNGKISFSGHKPSFFNGDIGIEDKYFDKIYYYPESCLRVVKKD